jgi:predicted house-cleaning noncanonical NTP pyrophosphatase (MazG superfamily)
MGDEVKVEKLIRDKIPELAAARGEALNTRVADEREMVGLLTNKLLEEVLEFQKTPTIEELADVYEVFYTLLSTFGDGDMDKVDRAADDKAERCGRFEDRIVLDLSASSEPEG